MSSDVVKINLLSVQKCETNCNNFEALTIAHNNHYQSNTNVTLAYFTISGDESQYVDYAGNFTNWRYTALLNGKN